MGSALATRLQLSHQLKVYDLNSAAVQRMVDAGASACARLDELASHCDIVFLCLPKSDHVRSALFETHGVVAGAASGLLIVDQTTGDPMATRSIVRDLASLGIDMIDAPVNGGISGAKAGTISIMAGAEEEQFARIEPVLRLISSNVFHAGTIGAGHVVKLVNNLISGVQRLLTFEGIALAAKKELAQLKRSRF